MFFLYKLRKAWVFVLIVLGLYFVSEETFVTFYPLLGFLFLGFMLRKDYKYAGFLMLLSLIPVFVDNELALSFSIYYPFLFVAISLFIKEYGFSNKGSLFLWLSILITLIFLAYLIFMDNHIGLYSQIIKGFKNDIIQLSSSLRSEGKNEELQSYYNIVKNIITNYAPFLITFQFILYNILNLYLLSMFFENLQPPFCERFGSMHVPIWGIWGINVGLVLYLFFEYPLSNYGMNMVLFFLAIYFFQGLSLSTLFFKINKIPTFIAIFFVFVLLLNQVIWLFVSIIGILDTYFNFKKHFKEAVL